MSTRDVTICHPVLSSMVCRGNHRPHHKEYCKDELRVILERCGFEVIKHEYFDRKQGYYFIDQEKKIISQHKVKKTPKSLLHNLIKNMGFLIPHLRNHHILLARKTKNIEEVIKNRLVTDSKEEWLNIRNSNHKV